MQDSAKLVLCTRDSCAANCCNIYSVDYIVCISHVVTARPKVLLHIHGTASKTLFFCHFICDF